MSIGGFIVLLLAFIFMIGCAVVIYNMDFHKYEEMNSKLLKEKEDCECEIGFTCDKHMKENFNRMHKI